ncbi:MULTISPECIES: uroporphyrinogen-III C-methyltransferase [Prochlorococcus]|uniref:uroporphyrinogen-III C-methyltransferase n=1 Tax=Prochlorococcus marinus (strain SARG / CCMP1375 / SS120) TaxID=167539 RepID=Q7V9H5_PROMA|nr:MULTISPECIES: uroporphyrinogen-III C-methyltransferase [Prochlorococcus]AAQ00902.1 Uroporphyrin-III c-methyltransferase [Prochlorococcus marinus subsp. marinus str. CCMP1375]KGG10603.1 Uroporphyrinogen-III methyltransferase [Prochlorococcus marinus str. LG]KGG19931.1 Uroporphyrinogen-III methyltransferase [Prochlorococcus marinus str. SS2]KGG23849.1 Uroporphyrinogen-III methyltransferase [Prochlorococcus marinus str. SS35]KGG31891.1 Uroporphyrinogen-III methyltransferase [Prochlorococcus ma
MKDKQLGTVYLVGAGPGDPDLLTVRAHRLLSQCDVLVYDALVPDEILKLVKKDCKSIFVGKLRGHHSTSQLKTNALLLELVKKNKCVVRLKGGDPFVFGRGGEEAAYLHKNGIGVEVVPAITSGIAASAYFGIPLTHRIASSSVTFVTGHEGIDKRRPSVNWKALAKASNTLVIYMGVHNLSYIVKELLAAGLSPKIPSAVIQQATVNGQRCLRTSLDSLVKEVKEQEFISPSIIIIGETINFQIEACAPSPAKVTMPISF